MQVLEQVLVNSALFSDEAVNDTLKVISQLTDWNALEACISPSLLELYKNKFIIQTTFQSNAFLCLDAVAQKKTPEIQSRLSNITDVLSYQSLLSNILDISQTCTPHLKTLVSESLSRIMQWLATSFTDMVVPIEYELVRIALRAI